MGPFIVQGKPFPETVQPNSLRNFANSTLLLLRREESPSTVISESKVAAKTVIILATVPEFPQSIFSLGAINPFFGGLTIHLPSSLVISTPINSKQLLIEIISSPGFP